MTKGRAARKKAKRSSAGVRPRLRRSEVWVPLQRHFFGDERVRRPCLLSPRDEELREKAK